jgi:hypothetical protein
MVTETFGTEQSSALETWNVAQPGNAESVQAKYSAVGFAGDAVQETRAPVLDVVARPVANIMAAYCAALCMVDRV